MIESVSLRHAIEHEALPRVRQSAALARLGCGPLARAALVGIAAGMPLLVLCDWLYDFSILAFPFAFYLRAVLLAAFALYLVHTGPRLGAYRFRFGRWLLCYLAVNLVYALVSADRLANLYHVSRIAFWILGTVAAYRLALCGALSEKILQRAIGATVLLGAAFTMYFMTRADTEAGQNASAYLLAWCLPLLLAAEKSRGRSALVALAAAAILLTVKRGAMLALGFSSIAYALAYLRLNGSPRALARVVGFLLVLGAVSLGVLASNWDAVKTRFEDTSGSGRDNMYAMLLEHWRKAEPQNLVFGFGINSVQRYTGMMYGSEDDRGPYAHSDWLQLMHDFGLVGIVLLAWLHAAFLALIRRGFRLRNPVTPSLAMGYTILFLVNIYSGHLLGPTAIYFGLLLVCGALAISTARQTVPVWSREWTG